MDVKKSLKNWSDDDKPREKMLNKGVNSLSDAELIAILINSGNKKQTAVELSREILLDNKLNLNELAKLTVADLIKYKGIGEAKAISIIAALELGKRRNYSDLLKKDKVSKSEDIFEIMGNILNDISHEQFWVLYLNNSNKILKKEKISQGGITSTSVDVRLIYKTAIDQHSVSIILCHNHPSGNLSPSSSDIKLTKQIVDAGNILNIKVLDHIIIGGNSFYSFADEGLI